MQPTERFALLIQRSPNAVPLDEAALLIAAHAHPKLDLATQLARLDDLAERCATPTRDGVIAHLFRSEGFHGNDGRLLRPRELVPRAVLDRRTGIPITLSVVLIEVARRLGVPLVGVGAPGHFIVLDKASGAFVDPFNAGRILDDDDRARLYGGVPLEPVRAAGDREPDARQPEGDLHPAGRPRRSALGRAAPVLFPYVPTRNGRSSPASWPR